ncbi:hypothetical protein [Methylobacterium sp. Leaf87]|nr:hypothetical protein [Methylobacterium sp. Leaf87]
MSQRCSCATLIGGDRDGDVRAAFAIDLVGVRNRTAIDFVF